MERASGDMALKVHLSELSHIRQTIAELNRAIRALSITDGLSEQCPSIKDRAGNQHPDGH